MKNTFETGLDVKENFINPEKSELSINTNSDNEKKHEEGRIKKKTKDEFDYLFWEASGKHLPELSEFSGLKSRGIFASFDGTGQIKAYCPVGFDTDVNWEDFIWHKQIENIPVTPYELFDSHISNINSYNRKFVFIPIEDKLEHKHIEKLKTKFIEKPEVELEVKKTEEEQIRIKKDSIEYVLIERVKEFTPDKRTFSSKKTETVSEILTKEPFEFIFSTDNVPYQEMLEKRNKLGGLKNKEDEIISLWKNSNKFKRVPDFVLSLEQGELKPRYGDLKKEFRKTNPAYAAKSLALTEIQKWREEKGNEETRNEFFLRFQEKMIKKHSAELEKLYTEIEKINSIFLPLEKREKEKLEAEKQRQIKKWEEKWEKQKAVFLEKYKGIPVKNL